LNWIDQCHFGDCRDTMRKMISDGVKVQTIVTSPPYWGLRDYGVDGQIGLEESFPEFLESLVDVFELCRELLTDDGTAWVNMGDSYSSVVTAVSSFRRDRAKVVPNGRKKSFGQLAPKNLIGQPFRLAFALQDAGWILRQDIVWHKPNPMPESARDRCTKAHEYLFLLSKSGRYYYDFDAMQEPVSGTAHARGTGVNPKSVSGWDTGTGAHRDLKGRYSGTGVGFGRGFDAAPKPRVRSKQNESFSGAVNELVSTRNKRSVWTIPTQAFDGAHFATFPEALVEPCVLAGSRVGDIVFAPFFGSGTVGQVASNLGRHWIGCELNAGNETLQHERLCQPGLELA
jgi:site-specific DNA-methyltransferase (cytosine-N4-specific)